MKAAEHMRAIDLRTRQQLSFGEIRKQVHVSKGTLSKWLEDYPLTEGRILELRRAGWKKGEASRERFRRTMRAKSDARDRKVYERQMKRFVKISKESLFIAGLMLYVAEGDKKTKADIAFTNTDPILVRFFVRWIVRFLELPKDKMRIQLHLYEGMDIQAEEKFWLDQAGLKRNQLWKSQVRALRPNSFSYKNSSRHGTCKLYIGSVPKKTELRLSIKAFFDTYSGSLHA